MVSWISPDLLKTWARVEGDCIDMESFFFSIILPNFSLNSDFSTRALEII